MFLQVTFLTQLSQCPFYIHRQTVQAEECDQDPHCLPAEYYENFNEMINMTQQFGNGPIQLIRMQNSIPLKWVINNLES